MPEHACFQKEGPVYTPIYHSPCCGDAHPIRQAYIYLCIPLHIFCWKPRCSGTCKIATSRRSGIALFLLGAKVQDLPEGSWGLSE